MEEKENTINVENSTKNNSEEVSFLKVDALTRGSYGLSLLLKTKDIIVGKRFLEEHKKS